MFVSRYKTKIDKTNFARLTLFTHLSSLYLQLHHCFFLSFNRESSNANTEQQPLISICTTTSSNDTSNLSLNKPFTSKIK